MLSEFSGAKVSGLKFSLRIHLEYVGDLDDDRLLYLNAAAGPTALVGPILFFLL